MMLPFFATPLGVANPGNAILMNMGGSLERELLAPFHPDEVDWKGGGGESKGQMMAFPYVDAAAIRARLNRVCGIGGWQGVPFPISAGQLGYAIAIWINGQWIMKADGAYAGDLDMENVDTRDARAVAKKADAIQKDAKGAISNALKRAAGAWGMGEYLRGLGRIYEDVESRGNSKVFTKDAKSRLYDIAAKEYFGHHAKIAGVHEAAARKAVAAGELSSAYGDAKAALRIRVDIFGRDHVTANKARAFFDDIVARQKAATAEAAPGAAGASPSAPAAPASQGQAAATESPVDLRTLVERMNAAVSAEEVRKASLPGWKAWVTDSTEDKAFRAAVEAAMQRFMPGWTIAGAAAAKTQAAGAPPPAPPAQAPTTATNGGAPAAARAPAGTAKKHTSARRRDERPSA